MKMFIPVSTTCRPVKSRSALRRASSQNSPYRGVWARKAFTLVELLIVIAVISILASLLVVGVNKAINFSHQVGVKTEMSQIELALANAARELGNVPYIPSGIILRDDLNYDTTDPIQASSQRLIQMMFPGITGPVDWNGNGNSTEVATLTAEQAWVFFLGGVPYSTGPDGFSRGSNPTVAGGKRKGPFYDFKPTRLVKQANGFYTYRDSWEAKTNVPLIVYNNISRDPSALDIDKPAGAPGRYLQTATKLFNPRGYQIISAGKDGVFGTAQSRPAIFNGYGDLGDGADDQANFSDSVLAKPVD